jgi:IS30 family transposase
MITPRSYTLPETIAEALGLVDYAARPYHSWERGINENTNDLIRQYARKGTSVDEMRPEDVINFMEKLNNRPRKFLGFQTPQSSIV